MLDARKDPDAIKGVYEQLVSEGVELDSSFVQQYNQILLKYAGTTLSETDPPQQVSITKCWRIFVFNWQAV